MQKMKRINKLPMKYKREIIYKTKIGNRKTYKANSIKLEWITTSYKWLRKKITHLQKDLDEIQGASCRLRKLCIRL